MSSDESSSMAAKPAQSPESISGATGGEQNPPSSSSLLSNQGPTDKVGRYTKSLFESFQDENYTGVKSHLPWFIRPFLSTKQIEEFWQSITYELGPLKSILPPQTKGSALLPSSVTHLQFSRGDLGVQLHFSPLSYGLLWAKKGSLSALDLIPPWSPPSYVDEQQGFTDEPISFRPHLLFPAVKGRIAIPKRPGRFPAVVLLPGTGDGDIDSVMGNTKIFKDLAGGLATKGVVVLRLEKPFIRMAYKVFVTKSLTVVDEYYPHNYLGLKYLASHPQVDAEQIYILGHSWGGRIAPPFCANSPVPIAGIISLAAPPLPVMPIQVVQMDYLQKHFPRDPEAHQRERDAFEQLGKLIEDPSTPPGTKSPTAAIPYLPFMPVPYLIDDHKRNANVTINVAEDLIRNRNMSIFFLQGDDDWLVSVDEQYQAWKDGLKPLQEELSNKNSQRLQFKLYPGLNHWFLRYEGSEKGFRVFDQPLHVEQEVVDDLVDWIRAVGEERKRA